MQKEEIFKNYLSDKIQESELINLLDNLQFKEIKKNGVIYTPFNVVNHMIKMASPEPSMTILEPSCGHGAFILPLLEYMHNNFQLKSTELFEWFNTKVTCLDINPITIQELKEIIILYFEKHYQLKIEENSLTNIHCIDSLLFESQQIFDICIGNPPYVRAKNIEASYLNFLKEHFHTCHKGTIDLYFAFIEKFNSLSKKLIFITPNSFLSSNAGESLKKHILQNLHTLIDFKDFKVFPDANVYTCILKTTQTSSDYILYSNNIVDVKLVDKQQLLKEQSNNGPFQEVLSGVATLSDSSYLVEKDSNDNFWATFNNNKFPIEKDIVVPYLKLTKIKSNNLSNIGFMILPYYQNFSIIPEQDLAKKYPLTYKYFLAIKEVLLSRDKGKTSKYEAWFAFGRKQGFHKLHTKEVIIVPQMIGGNCLPIKINISNLLAKYKRIIFTSGYIIPVHTGIKVPYNEILSEKFIQFSKENGKPWPGKVEPYYSLTGKQIKQFNP